MNVRGSISQVLDRLAAHPFALSCTAFAITTLTIIRDGSVVL